MSSSWKKQRIQDHFVVLCNELDVDRIVPVLKPEGMLTADEHEQLTSPHFTTRIRREKLLLFIPRKGRAHFEKFAECLVWSGQTDLARKIGVPVQEIRPSPYPPVQSQPTQQEQLQKLLEILSGVPTANVSSLSSSTGTPSIPVYPLPTHPFHPTYNPIVTHHSTQTAHPTHPTHTNLPVRVQSSIHPIQETGGDLHPGTAVRLTAQATARRTSQPAPDRGPPPPTLPPPLIPGPCKDVFVLYCNEEEVGGGNDFSDFVRDLVDFLIRTCGQRTKIHFDIYEPTPPPSWLLWTEERVRDSDCVLFVCSPVLAERLSANGPKRSVQMRQGSFNADSVYHLIESPKFVPVFLNYTGLTTTPDVHSQPYSSWIPASLLGASRYWLDMDGLQRAVGDPASEEEYSARLQHVLGDERLARNLQPVASILRYLQGVPDTQPPPPFPTPIVPPTEPTRPELIFRDSELMMVAERIPQDWQSVGIKLGLSYPTLESLRLKNVYDCQRAIMDMFSVWRRGRRELATRGALKEALKSAGYGRVAGEVFGRD